MKKGYGADKSKLYGIKNNGYFYNLDYSSEKKEKNWTKKRYHHDNKFAIQNLNVFLQWQSNWSQENQKGLEISTLYKYNWLRYYNNSKPA